MLVKLTTDENERYVEKQGLDLILIVQWSSSEHVQIKLQHLR